MPLKYVKAAWYTFGGLLLAVLLFGFIQNPALQSVVSILFFAFGIPVFLIAVVFTVVYLIQKKGSQSE